MDEASYISQQAIEHEVLGDGQIEAADFVDEETNGEPLPLEISETDEYLNRYKNTVELPESVVVGAGAGEPMIVVGGATMADSEAETQKYLEYYSHTAKQKSIAEFIKTQRNDHEVQEYRNRYMNTSEVAPAGVTRKQSINDFLTNVDPEKKAYRDRYKQTSVTPAVADVDSEAQSYENRYHNTENKIAEAITSEAAATRIQQQFRGFKTRKAMERELDEDNRRLMEEAQAWQQKQKSTAAATETITNDVETTVTETSPEPAHQHSSPNPRTIAVGTPGEVSRAASFQRVNSIVPLPNRYQKADSNKSIPGILAAASTTQLTNLPPSMPRGSTPGASIELLQKSMSVILPDVPFVDAVETQTTSTKATVSKRNSYHNLHSVAKNVEEIVDHHNDYHPLGGTMSQSASAGGISPPRAKSTTREGGIFSSPSRTRMQAFEYVSEIAPLSPRYKRRQQKEQDIVAAAETQWAPSAARGGQRTYTIPTAVPSSP